MVRIHRTFLYRFDTEPDCIQCRQKQKDHECADDRAANQRVSH